MNFRCVGSVVPFFDKFLLEIKHKRVKHIDRNYMISATCIMEQNGTSFGSVSTLKYTSLYENISSCILCNYTVTRWHEISLKYCK